MDVISYALSKKIAEHAVSGVQSMSVNGQTLTINTKDSGVLTMTFPTPKDGISVADIDVNANNQIVFTMSDGSEFISGKIPTVKGDAGFNPTITENADNTDKIYKLDITTADSTFTTPNLKGADGQGGGTADVPIEKIKVNGELQTPVNKVVDITVPDAYDDTEIKTELTKTNGEVSSLKSDLSNKITKFYASNQGETHLADSDNGKIMDMMVYGKSEQKQYSGKNLLSSVLKSQTTNGITCVDNGNGTYTFTGTATNNASFKVYGSDNVSSEVLKEFTNKKIVGCPSGGGAGKYFLRASDNITYAYTDFGQGAKITTDIRYIYIRFEKGVTVSRLIFKPMITDDLDATYDDFEPYLGGQPSPSPDYPQEVKGVVNPTVKVCGANLLNFDTYIVREGTANGITITKNSTDKTITYSGTPTDKGIVNVWIWGLYSNYINYKIPDGAFILKKDKTYYVGGIVLLCLYYDSEGTMNQAAIQSGGFGVIEITPSFDYYVIAIRARGFSSLDVVINETVVPYIGYTENVDEPYKEQVATLPYTLNAIPVTSGGNVTIDGQQYVADYVDVERGKLVRMVDDLNLDATVPIVDNTDMLLATPTEIYLTDEEVKSFKELATYYPHTNVMVTSEQLDGYTTFNYPISMANGWNYVKEQLGDTRDYIYDMELQSAEAYVNSEYAVALSELEV